MVLFLKNGEDVVFALLKPLRHSWGNRYSEVLSDNVKAGLGVSGGHKDVSFGGTREGLVCSSEMMESGRRS